MSRFPFREEVAGATAAARGRRGRYYLTDNFLRAWLAALTGPVAALNFRPMEQLVADADARLHEVEGAAFEKLVGVFYEEQSRKGVGNFPLMDRVRGYWDRGDTEIDLVAINEGTGVIRFGSCKRSASELVADLPVFDDHVERFLDQFPHYRGWRVEKVSLAPRVPEGMRRAMAERGRLVQDLTELIADL